MVGFQNKMKYPEQRPHIRTIPGLENAEFLRLGAIHRNTYLDSPALLDERMALRTQPHIRFAGQITGVEGYIESAAHGLLTPVLLSADMRRKKVAPPPKETALGALWGHVRGESRLANRDPRTTKHQLGHVPTAIGRHAKRLRAVARVLGAKDALENWGPGHGQIVGPIGNRHCLP